MTHIFQYLTISAYLFISSIHDIFCEKSFHNNKKNDSYTIARKTKNNKRGDNEWYGEWTEIIITTKNTEKKKKTKPDIYGLKIINSSSMGSKNYGWIFVKVCDENKHNKEITRT